MRPPAISLRAMQCFHESHPARDEFDNVIVWSLIYLYHQLSPQWQSMRRQMPPWKKRTTVRLALVAFALLVKWRLFANPPTFRWMARQSFASDPSPECSSTGTSSPALIRPVPRDFWALYPGTHSQGQRSVLPWSTATKYWYSSPPKHPYPGIAQGLTATSAAHAHCVPGFSLQHATDLVIARKAKLSPPILRTPEGNLGSRHLQQIRMQPTASTA